MNKVDINSAGHIYTTVNELFQTHSIKDIKNIHQKTIDTIQEKQEILKQLVGKKYENIIDAADSIINMKHLCNQLTSEIQTILHKCITLNQVEFSQVSKTKQVIQFLIEVNEQVRNHIKTHTIVRL